MNDAFDSLYVGLHSHGRFDLRPLYLIWHVGNWISSHCSFETFPRTATKVSYKESTVEASRTCIISLYIKFRLTGYAFLKIKLLNLRINLYNLG